ncbi:MAG: 5'-methylthioadenosine/adenosylhomocysteine nucleosidase [Ruminococcaceae bacterium]|nr:5'-methylthioadenosine/adenosylhomocysteine nucleosidase [Oscillospiraceae bacterium]
MNNLIGIIGAMDIEVDAIIASMTDIEENIISSVKFVRGKLFGKDVVVAKCGIGKVFAAICAQTMILEYDPSVIINTGVAGSLVKGFNVLDVAVASSVVQHDMDTSAIGDPRGLISGINVIYIDTDKDVSNALKSAALNVKCNVKEGIIASGDKFMADAEEKEAINKQFNAIACEMEGASIGQVCYVNGVPFGILRAISDGDGAEMDYMTFAPKAAEQSTNIVKEFIKIYSEV